MSKIGSFPFSSKAKSDSIGQIDNRLPSGQIPSPGSVTVSALTAKPDGRFDNATRASSTSVDASLGFPEDGWDDFDDFDIPPKGKNVSFNSEKCETRTEASPPPCEEKSSHTGKAGSEVSVTEPDKTLCEKEQSRVEIDEQECSVQDVAAVLPGPGRDLEDDLFGDSPPRPCRRRRSAHIKSILSDSDEDNSDEAKGNNLFKILFIISHN